MFTPQQTSNGQTKPFSEWLQDVIDTFAVNGHDISAQALKYGSLGFRYDYELGETPRQAYFNEISYWED